MSEEAIYKQLEICQKQLTDARSRLDATFMLLEFHKQITKSTEQRCAELEDFLKKLWYDSSNGQKSAIDKVLRRTK